MGGYWSNWTMLLVKLVKVVKVVKVVKLVKLEADRGYHNAVRAARREVSTVRPTTWEARGMGTFPRNERAAWGPFRGMTRAWATLAKLVKVVKVVKLVKLEAWETFPMKVPKCDKVSVCCARGTRSEAGQN